MKTPDDEKKLEGLTQDVYWGGAKHDGHRMNMGSKPKRAKLADNVKSYLNGLACFRTVEGCTHT